MHRICGKTEKESRILTEVGFQFFLEKETMQTRILSESKRKREQIITPFLRSLFY